MKRYPILLSLLLIIVISGCTTQDQITTSSKDGIVITDFAFDYNSIYSGDRISLYLEVQNVGGEPGFLENISVYGVDMPASDATELDWGHAGSSINLIGSNLGDDDDRRLEPPDPDIDIEGEIYYYEWTLESPTSIGAKTTYNFFSRVAYRYNTTYTGVIRIIQESYLKSLPPEERKALFESGGLVSSIITGGPLSLKPEASNYFIVHEASPNPRPITFVINNVGSGYTYLSGKPYYVELAEINGDISNCNNNDHQIKLSKGKRGILRCEYDPPGINNFTYSMDKTFTLRFEYFYHVDGKAPITVNPVRR